MELDLENPLSNFHHFCPATTAPSLFPVESDHMAAQNYIDSLGTGDLHVSLRREAISSISQFSCKLGPFSSYLAINYLDRFLSSRGMLVLQQSKTWVLRLVSISCVSLAAKMTKTEFSLTDFQGDRGLIFDAQTVERMEYLILGALKWRMRSITPFAFVSFFISLFKLKEAPVIQAIKARAVELIFKAQIDTNFLEFKPSIIAASALLSACHELFPLQFPSFRRAISSCSCVNKENMIKCYNSMQEIDMVSSSNTPANALDRHVSSSGSEISTAGATTVTSVTQRDIKRRKVNDYGTIIKWSTSLRSKSEVLIHGPL
ncbi:Cyclin D6;1 [Hibiscus trionum]|uniref:Cyclin D61 n=1 Tax=Hibiscus trionum TaxID=183268 RepID=A0A9W7MWU9_HIBTR|nr:Cyclin D6;1 [Hibiscus trionum]